MEVLLERESRTFIRVIDGKRFDITYVYRYNGPDHKYQHCCRGTAEALTSKYNPLQRGQLRYIYVNTGKAEIHSELYVKVI